MLLIVGSLVLALLNVLSMWFIAEHFKFAWWFYIAIQFVWTPYDVLTKQYGFIALGVVMMVIAIRGLIKERQHDLCCDRCAMFR